MAIGTIGNSINGDLANVSVGFASDLITQLGEIGLWLQAIGVVVIIWVIIQIINFFFNRKKKKYLESIERRLKRIEEKIDNLPKSIKKK